MPETLKIDETSEQQLSTPPANNAKPTNAEFTSTSRQLVVGDQKVTLRILKMNGSTMLFISNGATEFMDELAVALPSGNNDMVSSTLLGEPVLTDSQRLARQLSKRFNRQFFVSCNIPMTDFNGRLLESALSSFISEHEVEFV